MKTNNEKMNKNFENTINGNTRLNEASKLTMSKSMFKLTSVLMISGIVIMMILLSVSYVSAYKLACLKYGESVPSAENPRFTCWHDLCQVCVSDNKFPVHIGNCKDVKGCNMWGDGTQNNDSVPPILTVLSPVDDFVYNSTTVLFDIKTNEPSSLYYTDNVNGRGRWSGLGSKVTEIKKKIRLKEGENDLTIKAKDRNDNEISVVRKFFVDSKKPKITKTTPATGFADGIFTVEFQEDNPKTLTLYYGNNLTGIRNAQVNLGNCNTNKGRTSCAVEVNLEDYNEQQIEYYFELIDIAQNSYKSRIIKLKVDTKDPIITNLDSFWTQGVGKDNKYIYFKINITEPNFQSVNYIDNSEKSPREKNICSSLKNGVCDKKVTFTVKGPHAVDIIVSDKAGNAISQRIEFTVV